VSEYLQQNVKLWPVSNGKQCKQCSGSNSGEILSQKLQIVARSQKYPNNLTAILDNGRIHFQNLRQCFNPIIRLC